MLIDHETNPPSFTLICDGCAIPAGKAGTPGGPWRPAIFASPNAAIVAARTKYWKIRKLPGKVQYVTYCRECR